MKNDSHFYQDRNSFFLWHCITNSFKVSLSHLETAGVNNTSLMWQPANVMHLSSNFWNVKRNIIKCKTNLRHNKSRIWKIKLPTVAFTLQAKANKSATLLIPILNSRHSSHKSFKVKSWYSSAKPSSSAVAGTWNKYF